MFSLWPNDWELPRKRSNLGGPVPNPMYDPNYAEKKAERERQEREASNARLMAEINETHRKLTEMGNNWGNDQEYEFAGMPQEEICATDTIDTSEIDEIVSRANCNIGDKSQHAKAFRSMKVINENLDKNIKKLRNDENESVSKAEMLDLLNAFAEYNKKLEIYFTSTEYNNDTNSSHIFLSMEMKNEEISQRINDLESIDEEFVTKESALDLLITFSNYNHNVENHFKSVTTGGCSNIVVDEHNVGVKYLDISKTKVLLVQIPEELYLKDGYKSLEKMMETLKQSGVVVVAVPKSVNLVNITADDLKKMDLYKVAALRAKKR